MKSLAKKLQFLRSLSFYALAGGLIVAVMLPVYSERKNFVGKKISRIEVVGNHSLSADRVVESLPFSKGDVLEEAMLNQAVKALFQTGDFENVELRAKILPDGTLLITVVVQERPRIKEILLIGEQELYETDLKGILPFREGDVYSPQRAKDAVQKIKDKYRDEGFLLAEIWLQVAESPDGVIISYMIDEGQNIPIARINITGTKNVSPGELLDIMDQKEEGFLEDGVFRESKFEEDKFKILAYAKTLGYVDAEIDPAGTGYEIRWRNPKKPADGRVVVVTYKLNEGDIRYFGGYSLDHDPAGINEEFNPRERRKKGKESLNPVFTPEQLLSFLEFDGDNAGAVFDEGRFYRDRNTLQQAYSTHGYVFAQIQPVYTNFALTEENLSRYEACAGAPAAGEDGKRCSDIGKSINVDRLRGLLKKNPKMRGRTLRHVHFTVRENNLAYIETIIVKGMKKTHENVIRRQILVKEGQLFNSQLVERSREKIFNLGYFKEVNLDMRPGSDDRKMNLVISVTEQPTGTITLGGTYGTVSGFAVYTELGENNLYGTGQRLSGRVQYGPVARQVSATWVEPWIYESCDGVTGRYWYNKLKNFDEAAGLSEINIQVDNLRSENENLGKRVRSIVDEETAGIVVGPKGSMNVSVEVLDRIKMRLRTLMQSRVEKEEECYRGFPSPWALSLSAVYSSYKYTTSALAVSVDSNDTFEGATYNVNAFGTGVRLAHSFGLNWAHYHQYNPVWSLATNPSSLVSSDVLRRVGLGWQFQSGITNGLIYDNRDNVFNSTNGVHIDTSFQTVGGLLGGGDHFNRYRLQAAHYWWPFDFTFWGLIKSRNLQRWRVVIESRISTTFTYATSPGYGRHQDAETNPYVEQGDKLYLGGYESLRGYDYRTDAHFPKPWWGYGGANHMMLGGLELRIPLEPSMLWWTFFFDAGSLYINPGELTGSYRTAFEDYESGLRSSIDKMSWQQIYYYQHFSNYKKAGYDNSFDWNDPSRAVLAQNNVAWDRGLYSWGFGLRVQIPVLPIRLFMAQKLYFDKNAAGLPFKPIPDDKKFTFVFGIGDYRF